MDDDATVDRPDEQENWASDLVLMELRIGLDFAIAEECGRWDKCQDYRDVFDDHVIIIEYRLMDFDKTCADVGDALSIVLRDVEVTAPGSSSYRYLDC